MGMSWDAEQRECAFFYLLSIFIKWQQVQSKLSIHPAWVCMSIRLYNSLVQSHFDFCIC